MCFKHIKIAWWNPDRWSPFVESMSTKWRGKEGPQQIAVSAILLNIQRHDSSGGQKGSAHLNSKPAWPIKLLKAKDRWLHEGLADFACGNGCSCDEAFLQPEMVGLAYDLWVSDNQ